MTFKTLFATVSTAALLATPIAAQDNPVNDPGATMSMGDATPENTTDNVGGTTYDSQMFATADSLNGALAGKTMDAGNPWVGKMVKLSDGNDAGTINGVYLDDAGMATAKVELDDSLGINADEFLISLGAAEMTDGDVELAMTTEEFVQSASEVVPVDPGAEKQAYD